MILHVFGSFPLWNMYFVYILEYSFRYIWMLFAGFGCLHAGEVKRVKKTYFVGPCFMPRVFCTYMYIYKFLFNFLCILNTEVMYIFIVEFCLVNFSNRPGTDSVFRCRVTIVIRDYPKNFIFTKNSDFILSYHYYGCIVYPGGYSISFSFYFNEMKS
ncbi:hypothetical protein RND81_04G224100 [Saponaria officinalis]|uniref:Uncharacterized protein n=1 Tax=Saponaria officinalis TaxID=3572 RepID=A0AAW1LPX1_SAPOF